MTNKMKIKLFADGADIGRFIRLYAAGQIDGITTNPTLMRKAGVTSYRAFAKEILSQIKYIPVSFEVLADDFPGMERQARKISAWGDNVYVKIPVTNTKGASSLPLIKKLSADGLKLNVTAVLTLEQVEEVLQALSPETKSIISVFAGRIADTGIDPCRIMRKAVVLQKEKLRQNDAISPASENPPNTEILWASSRELYNIFQAQKCGADIITVTQDILDKLPLVGRSLTEVSLDTVTMFYGDALAAGYRL